MVVRRTLFFCGVFRTQRQRKVANRYAGAVNRKSPAGIPACRAFLYFRCRAIRVAVRMPRKRARRHRLRLLLLGFCFGTHVCQQGIIAACLTVSTWITSLSGQQNRISPFCARGGLPP